MCKNHDGIKLRTVPFSQKGTANKLEGDVGMPNLQSLDKLKQRLNDEAKLQVEIVSASSREGKVESRLTLQAQSAGGAK